MNTKEKLQIFIGFVAFAIWSAMSYYDPSMRPDYAKFIISVVVGLVALVLRDMNGSPQPPKE